MFGICWNERKVHNASDFARIVSRYLELLSQHLNRRPDTSVDQTVLKKTDVRFRVDVVRCIQGRVGGVLLCRRN